ncbi:hypothetical protein NQ318_006893 [Aromia moschata]|uniref:Uncharacterized protein n=1 Tax=Aromia moschata TaxID=1265417 RepID=A0AAV8YJG5_9CUCU|nr:hypothetical protein NQ318_006893 [Aromia moschata]
MNRPARRYEETIGRKGTGGSSCKEDQRFTRKVSEEAVPPQENQAKAGAEEPIFEFLLSSQYLSCCSANVRRVWQLEYNKTSEGYEDCQATIRSFDLNLSDIGNYFLNT